MFSVVARTRCRGGLPPLRAPVWGSAVAVARGKLLGTENGWRGHQQRGQGGAQGRGLRRAMLSLASVFAGATGLGTQQDHAQDHDHHQNHNQQQQTPAQGGEEGQQRLDPDGPIFDVVVVGGGIVGLATAREIMKRYPSQTVCVVEKEGNVAMHQSGHNSGVIHAGMYYEPGTTMAKCCVRGADLIYEYCEEKGLPYQRCGKLIVAQTKQEHDEWIELLYRRGVANGVKDLSIVYGKDIEALEPNVRGYSALYSPNTGVTDFAAVCRAFADDIRASGRGTIKLSFEVAAFNPTYAGTEPLVEVEGREPGQKGPTVRVRGRRIITCAGLHADRVARLGGGEREPRVVPLRGTYYQMKAGHQGICRMNVYPVPSGTGIGVHFTPSVSQQRGEGIIIGPSMCISFKREGYRSTDFSAADTVDAFTQPGLFKFFLSNFKTTVTEIYRDMSKGAFIREAQRLIPSVTEDMTEESFSGVMVQVMTADATAASDFLFERRCLGGRVLHVRSAPSPACTSSMAIAEHIVDVAAQDFGWTRVQHS